MSKSAKPTDKIPLMLTRQEWNAIWAALPSSSQLGAKILKAID